MVDSAISGLDPAPQTLSDSDLTILSQNVNGNWVTIKMTLGQLKTFIRFGLDIASIFGLTEILTNKSDAAHTHSIDNIPGLTAALVGKASTVHAHSLNDITGLPTALAGKSDNGHIHTIANITDLQNALNARVETSQLGAAGGVATLGPDGKLSVDQTPTAFAWIVVVNDFSELPSTGTVGVLYIDDSTSVTYRWNGTQYVVTSNLENVILLGDQPDNAYPGDKGKIAYDHAISAHAPADAQKNSDITLAEIETKLVGEINTHSHPISSVTGLEIALNNKSETTHTHVIGDVAGLASALDAKVETSLVGSASGVASLDAGGHLPLGQLPSLNFILDPDLISINQYMESTAGIVIPPTATDTTLTGDVYAGDLVSTTVPLEFMFNWLGDEPVSFMFIQGESVELKFAETGDLLTDTSEQLTLALSYIDVDPGEGAPIERHARITVSNTILSRTADLIVGSDGNLTELKLERSKGILSIFLDDMLVLAADIGVVPNHIHFLSADNTLTELSFVFVETTVTVYDAPLLTDGVLYRVSVDCVVNSRPLFAGDCFFLYSKRTRIILLRSAQRQELLENSILNHTHLITQVNGLSQQLTNIQTALDNKSPNTHGHDIGDITDLQFALDTITGDIATKAAGNHQHAIADVADLQATIDDINLNKASTVHTHTIADVAGLQAELDGKAGSTHSHPEITASSILLSGFTVATNPDRVADGDSTKTAFEKIQRQLDLLSRFSANVFEPSDDFPFVQADGTLYRFNSGSIIDTQSTQNVTLQPGYYRLIAGAPCEYTGGVIDAIGKWVKVYKASDSNEVYVSQETAGLDATIVSEVNSLGNNPFGYIGGVGYQSSAVFQYLFKQIEELHRGLDGTSPDLGTRNGAIAVSAPLIVAVPLEITMVIGANTTAAVDQHGGFVWIRELLAVAVTTPDNFTLTNGIYDGSILGWVSPGTITIDVDTFSGYRAERSNNWNDVVTYIVPALGTPVADVKYNIGLQSEDGLIKFIETVYTSAAGGSFTIKENGVDLFGELISTLPAKIKIRTLSEMIFELSLLDGADAVTNSKMIFTDGENLNKFYLEGLFVDAADVEPSMVDVDYPTPAGRTWSVAGAVNDHVNDILYWDRVSQLNIGTELDPVMANNYSASTSIASVEWLDIDIAAFDEIGVKSVDIYLSTQATLAPAKSDNIGHISLNNVDNAGVITTTLSDFVSADLVDVAALAIDSIKITRTSDIEVNVEYMDGTPQSSRLFTAVAGVLFVYVEVTTDTGVAILNLPYSYGTV